MSVLWETFEIDCAVALTFTLMHPNCSVQRDETQPITSKKIAKK
jgi:hypothetical protein